MPTVETAGNTVATCHATGNANMPYAFYTTCVDFPLGKVNSPGGLIDMIDDAKDITRKTFLRHIGRQQMIEIEAQLGYANHPSKGLTMANDYHVSFHRSKLFGQRCYFFKWSGIEHIFLPQTSRLS